MPSTIWCPDCPDCPDCCDCRFPSALIAMGASALYPISGCRAIRDAASASRGTSLSSGEADASWAMGSVGIVIFRTRAITPSAWVGVLSVCFAVFEGCGGKKLFGRRALADLRRRWG